MDWRTFIKTVCAMPFLNSFEVSGSTQIADQNGSYKNGGLFPEIRVISVGSGGWKFLDHHYFRSYMYPSLGLAPEQIMFIGRTGRIFHGPRPEDQDPLWWEFSPEGDGFERDISRIEDFKKYFNDSRQDIARFIQAADWIYLVASLDNGMAIVACDEVTQMCRDVGARVIGLVATPHYGMSENRDRCRRLAKASDRVVTNMIDNGHPVILDEGNWGGSIGESVRWHWHYQDEALAMISQVSKSQHIDVFSKMVADSSRISCAVGMGSSAAEAIQEAIEFETSGWATRLDGKSMTATGAVIRVSGHPDMLERLRTEVLAALQMPDHFKRDGYSYWRKGAKFIVSVEPNDWSKNEMYFCLTVLSTGLEIV